MPSQNKGLNKSRIAYLGALSLLFSYVEMLLPRIVPFLRLGLGNTIILLALELDFASFLLLNLVRILANAMLSGTLFSPFVLISLVQGFASAIIMYFLYKIFKSGRFISLYGISLLGSGISGVVQIIVSSWYLGKGTYSLMGPMLIFSVFSGLFTAFLALNLKIPIKAPILIKSEEKVDYLSAKDTLIIIICILISAAVTMICKSSIMLLICMIAAFSFQLICGRKIFIMPYISVWLFILFCTIFTVNGRVLYKIGSISITEGALLDGIQKSLKLSIVCALSQAAATLQLDPSSTSIVGMTLSYFSGLTNSFRKSEGKLLVRVNSTLRAEEIKETIYNKKGITVLKTIIMTLIIIILFVVSYEK